MAVCVVWLAGAFGAKRSTQAQTIGSRVLQASLPLAGALLLQRMRRRSITAAVTVLVLIPVVAALVGVLAVSGFMLDPQLTRTMAVVLAVGTVSVPAGLLLGRGLARDSVWEREARGRERAKRSQIAEQAARRGESCKSNRTRAPFRV